MEIHHHELIIASLYAGRAYVWTGLRITHLLLILKAGAFTALLKQSRA
jgi:hypothetical protein